MRRVLITTSSAGKLRDFAGAASAWGIEIAALPGFGSLPGVEEDGSTFEANAQKKAEHYSRLAAGELVLAEGTVEVRHGAASLKGQRVSVWHPGVVSVPRREAA